MRRSSWILILLSLLVLGALVFVQLRPLDRDAEPFDANEAEALIVQARAAIESHSVKGVMALLAPDAVVAEMKPEQLRQVLGRIFQSAGPSRANVKWKFRGTPTDLGDSGSASIDLSVNQKGGVGGDVTYNSTVHFTVRKVKIAHWFGLYSTEEWRVSAVDVTHPFDTLYL